MDRPKYQYEAMKWIHELELLNSDMVINNIKLNILMVSKRIKEVELLIYRENKSMLVLLELSWMGRKFFKKQIFAEVQDVLNQLLPSFRIRVIDDPRIMEMAVARVKQALTGGKNETPNNPSDVPNKPASQSENDNPDVIAAAAFAATNANIEADQAKQSETSGEVLKTTGANDSSEK